MFGCAVALDGSTLVVGAGSDDSAAFAAGRVTVFAFDGATWVEEAHLTSPDGARAGQFGLDVDVSGDRLIVGAPFHEAGGTWEAGVAYIYVRSAGTWSLEATLVPSVVQFSANAGFGVAIDDDVALMGTPEGTIPHPDGSVDVFRRRGSSWTLEATLVPSNPSPISNDWFGYSSDVDGDLAAVGAPRPVDGAGRVYVFRHVGGGAWQEVAAIVSSLAFSGDQLGWSVSTSGNTVAAGAVPGASVCCPQGPGPAYACVFVEEAGTWREQECLSHPDGSTTADFGAGVAVHGDRLVVGAPDNDGPLGALSDAYLFERASGDWQLVERMRPSPAARWFGGAVDLTACCIAVGAPSDPNVSGGGWQGEAFTYSSSASPAAEVSAASSPLPLLVAKHPLGVSVSFEDLGPASLAYDVHGGAIGSWYSHAPIQCASAPPVVDSRRTTTLPAEAGSSYYLVSTRTACGEGGPLGTDSFGRTLPPGAPPCPP